VGLQERVQPSQAVVEPWQRQPWHLAVLSSWLLALRLLGMAQLMMQQSTRCLSQGKATNSPSSEALLSPSRPCSCCRGAEALSLVPSEENPPLSVDPIHRCLSKILHELVTVCWQATQRSL